MQISHGSAGSKYLQFHKYTCVSMQAMQHSSKFCSVTYLKTLIVVHLAKPPTLEVTNLCHPLSGTHHKLQ